MNNSYAQFPQCWRAFIWLLKQFWETRRRFSSPFQLLTTLPCLPGMHILTQMTAGLRYLQHYTYVFPV